MNADYRTPTTYYSDARTFMLKRKLGNDGLAALNFLWCWTAMHKVNGILTGMNEDWIEAVSFWDGKQGEFVPVLLELQYLDKLEDGTYAIHGWAETNSWAADADNRSDKARLSGMARNYPELYEELTAQGATGIDSASYAKLTAEYNSRGIIRSSSTSLRIASESLAPTPTPSPAPVPTPVPSLQKEEVVQEKPASSSSSLGKEAPSVKSSKVVEQPGKSEPLSGQGMNFAKTGKTHEQATIPFEQVEQAENPANQEPATLAGIFAEWNARLGTLGFPKVAKVTPRRKAAFDARLCVSQERSSLAWWVALFEKIAASDFMRESAAQKANWLTIDWVLNEHNMMKILEGKYDSERPVIADIFHKQNKHSKRTYAQEDSSSAAPDEATADVSGGMPEDARRRLSEMYRLMHGTNDGNPYEVMEATVCGAEVPAIEAEFSTESGEDMNIPDAVQDDGIEGATCSYDQLKGEISAEDEEYYQSYIEELEELDRINAEYMKAGETNDQQ